MHLAYAHAIGQLTYTLQALGPCVLQIDSLYALALLAISQLGFLTIRAQALYLTGRQTAHNLHAHLLSVT